MALLFLDSFDHYTDGADKYLSGSASITSSGRHGAGCTGHNRVAPNPTHPRMVCGAAYKFDSTFQVFVELRDVLGHICTAYTMNDGSIQVAMFGGPEVHSAGDLIRVHHWHYIELDFTVGSETVVVSEQPQTRYGLGARVLLDGAVVIDDALGVGGWMNGEPSAAKWSHVDIFPNAVGTYDDLYICDGSGPAPHNAPLGDVQIDVIRPNGAGASTQWALTGALANWDATNDLTPDDDTTKVTAATAGLSDLYQMEDINTNNSILGAQLLINARRTEEGFAALTPLLRHAGVTTALAARHLTTTYFYRNRNIFVTMPNGDPLTDAHVNALQAGFRRDL